MNWLDVLLLLIIGFSVLLGIRRGLVRISIGLVAIFVGIIAGLWFYAAGAAFLRPFGVPPQLANLLGFLLIFLIIVIAGLILSRILNRMFKAIGLGWLDRLLGAAFGLVRGIIIAMVLLMAILAFYPGKPPQPVVESRVAPHVAGGAKMLAHLAPPKIREAFVHSYDQVRKSWSDLFKHES
jgi:membrane protein required for colicin V production